MLTIIIILFWNGFSSGRYLHISGELKYLKYFHFEFFLLIFILLGVKGLKKNSSSHSVRCRQLDLIPRRLCVATPFYGIQTSCFLGSSILELVWWSMLTHWIYRAITCVSLNLILSRLRIDFFLWISLSFFSLSVFHFVRYFFYISCNSYFHSIFIPSINFIAIVVSQPTNRHQQRHHHRPYASTSTLHFCINCLYFGCKNQQKWLWSGCDRVKKIAHRAEMLFYMLPRWRGFQLNF